MKQSIVFFNKQAIVIGPTPPGTGVKAFAFFETSSNATSPTIPLSVLFIPTSITIYKGKEFNDWNGHALITSLKDKSLRKLIINDIENVKEEIIFKNKIGRIRDIQIHPRSGKIYFLGGEVLWVMKKS